MGLIDFRLDPSLFSPRRRDIWNFQKNSGIFLKMNGIRMLLEVVAKSVACEVELHFDFDRLKKSLDFLSVQKNMKRKLLVKDGKHDGGVCKKKQMKQVVIDLTSDASDRVQVNASDSVQVNDSNVDKSNVQQLKFDSNDVPLFMKNVVGNAANGSKVKEIVVDLMSVSKHEIDFLVLMNTASVDWVRFFCIVSLSE